MPDDNAVRRWRPRPSNGSRPAKGHSGSIHAGGVALRAACYDDAVPTDAALHLARNDAFRLVLGELVLASGLVACILYLLRARKADLSALYFGIAGVLYGLRPIVELDLLRTAFPVFPWASLDSGITLIVGIPFVLFFGSTIARGYPWVTRGFITAQVLLASAGIPVILLHGPVRYVWFLDGVVSIASVIVFVWIAFHPKAPLDREVRILKLGLLVFGVFVLVQNLVSVDLLPDFGNWEPVGMVILLCTVGYVSAARTIRTERNWIAIRRELEIARQIQLSILPREMPRTKALQVAARYVPITAVAGDFYDFLVVDGDRAGILVADVSGHGVPAALIASMVKIAIAAQMPHAEDPARVLTGVNRTLCGKLQGQFVTAAYLFIDAAAGRMRYAAAGHPPMLWRRCKDQRIHVVEENGLILGFQAEAAYTFTERETSPGDRFLLYTDGVLEAANEAGEFFGEERLLKEMEEARTVGAEDFATSLLHDVGSWAGYGRGRPQDDDLTLLIVDCRSRASE